MDEILFCTILWLFTICWHHLTTLPSVQRFLHKCPLPWLWQWYSVLLIGLAYLQGRSIWDIVVFDYLALDWLDPEAIQRQLSTLLPSHVTDDEKKQLMMSPELRWIALFAPLASLIAFLAVCVHVALNVRFGYTLQFQAKCSKCKEWMTHTAPPNKTCSLGECRNPAKWSCTERSYFCTDHKDTYTEVKVHSPANCLSRRYRRCYNAFTPTWCVKCGESTATLYEKNCGTYRCEEHRELSEGDTSQPHQLQTPWAPAKCQSHVLFCLIMPAVFVTLALRAEIRMLTVMTGTAMLLVDNQMTTTWYQAQNLEICANTLDLAFASTFQFYTVFTFGVLVHSYMVSSKFAGREHEEAMYYAGLQGVHLYVLFGVLQLFVFIAIAVLSRQKKDNAYYLMVLEDQVLPFLAPIILVSTFLCMYNMTIIGNLKDVRAHLGRANVKFFATRSLLLISALQPQVLAGFTQGSWLLEKLRYMHELGWLSAIPDYVHLSVPRAKLWHSALLSIECLAVVIWNLCMWRRRPKYFRPADEEEDGRTGSLTARAREPAEGYMLLDGEVPHVT